MDNQSVMNNILTMFVDSVVNDEYEEEIEDKIRVILERLCDRYGIDIKEYYIQIISKLMEIAS